MTQAYKVTQAARIVGISPSSIRNYARDYSDLMSESANPERGKPRYFTQSDIDVFHTITVLRADGEASTAILQRLQDGERIVPEKPQNDAVNDDTTGAKQTALVTELTIKAAQLETELDTTKQDRDRLRVQVDTLDQRVQSLSEDVTAITSESAEARGALEAEKRFNRVLLIAAAVALVLLVVVLLLVAGGVV